MGRARKRPASQGLPIEDMLLWRLREWLHWHHASGFHQAAHLLISEELDGTRLERRAEEEGLAHALQAFVELGREVELRSYSPSGDD